jgi:hypothetical protein
MVGKFDVKQKTTRTTRNVSPQLQGARSLPQRSAAGRSGSDAGQQRAHRRRGCAAHRLCRRRQQVGQGHKGVCCRLFLSATLSPSHCAPTLRACCVLCACACACAWSQRRLLLYSLLSAILSPSHCAPALRACVVCCVSAHVCVCVCAWSRYVSCYIPLSLSALVRYSFFVSMLTDLTSHFMWVLCVLCVVLCVVVLLCVVCCMLCVVCCVMCCVFVFVCVSTLDKATSPWLQLLTSTFFSAGLLLFSASPIFQSLFVLPFAAFPPSPLSHNASWKSQFVDSIWRGK